MSVYRQGRLTRDHFRHISLLEPTTGRVEARAVSSRSNALWFSVNTESGRVREANFGDFYTNSALAMAEHLEGDEALLVIGEGEVYQLRTRHPKPVIVDRERILEFPLSDASEVAFALVVPGRVYIFDGSPPRDPHEQIERLTSRAAFRALLA